jgi:hypothetical protein
MNTRKTEEPQKKKYPFEDRFWTGHYHDLLQSSLADME